MQMISPANHLTYIRKCLIVYVFAPFGVTHADGLDQLIEANVLNADVAHRNLSWVMPDQKAEVISHLHLLATDPKSREPAEDALVALNDAEAIRENVAALRAGPNGRDAFYRLQRFGQDDLLAYLADTYDAPPDELDGGTPMRPRCVPFDAIQIATSVIARSSSFPPDTVAWAAGIRRDVGWQAGSKLIDCYSQFLEWWGKNKREVQSGNYKAASWLPSTSLRPDYGHRAPPPPALKPPPPNASLMRISDFIRIWKVSHAEDFLADHVPISDEGAKQKGLPTVGSGVSPSDGTVATTIGMNSNISPPRGWIGAIAVTIFTVTALMGWLAMTKRRQ